MPFLNNNFQSDQDSGTRTGIIVLSVLLLLLIGFFIWSNYRLTRTSPDSKKDSFLSSIFSTDNKISTSQDSDADSLSDDEEKKLNTDPQKIDTDGDDLTDGEEVNVYKTNPLQGDSDSDSSKDGDEIKNRTNPLDPSANAIWPPAPTNLSPNN